MSVFAVDGLPQSDLGAWIAPRLGREFGAVTTHVPSGFERYVRIFHPADGGGDESTTWAMVAEAAGTVMHPTAQFTALAGPDRAGTLDVPPPQLGNLTVRQLRALVSVLRPHTRAPQDCVFGFWAGWSVLARPDRITAYRDGQPHSHTPPPLPAHLRPPPPLGRLDLPHRDYALFRGDLGLAERFGSWLTEDVLIVQSPNLWWPADHAWFVATEIDFDSTLVGGSASLAADLTGNQALETAEVAPTDKLHSKADTVNR